MLAETINLLETLRKNINHEVTIDLHLSPAGLHLRFLWGRSPVYGFEHIATREQVESWNAGVEQIVIQSLCARVSAEIRRSYKAHKNNS